MLVEGEDERKGGAADAARVSAERRFETVASRSGSGRSPAEVRPIASTPSSISDRLVAEPQRDRQPEQRLDASRSGRRARPPAARPRAAASALSSSCDRGALQPATTTAPRTAARARRRAGCEITIAASAGLELRAPATSSRAPAAPAAEPSGETKDERLACGAAASNASASSSRAPVAAALEAAQGPSAQSRGAAITIRVLGRARQRQGDVAQVDVVAVEAGREALLGDLAARDLGEPLGDEVRRRVVARAARLALGRRLGDHRGRGAAAAAASKASGAVSLRSGLGPRDDREHQHHGREERRAAASGGRGPGSRREAHGRAAGYGRRAPAVHPPSRAPVAGHARPRATYPLSHGRGTRRASCSSTTSTLSRPCSAIRCARTATR